MKITSGMMAVVLLAGIGWAPSAHAQGAPQGSYTKSCTGVSVQGDSLVATCRTADRRDQVSSLAGFRRCVGDIGNSNGVLLCNLQGGGQARGQVVQGQGSGPGGPGSAGPGSPSQGSAPSGYGAPSQGYGNRTR